MKRNIITSAFALMLLLATTTSCEDQLTEINPNKETADSYWTNLDQVQSGLNATYAVLRKEAVLNTRFEAVRCDLAWPSNERPAGITEAQNWYEHLYNDSNDAIRLKWEALYTGVWRANQVIEALEELGSGVDTARWTQQMAEARFLRGLFYFYLHSAFNNGSVILKQKSPESIDEFHQGLSSSKDVMEFFRKDLRYAIDNLAETRTESTSHVPVKATAETILGTSYLYEKDYAAARDMFKSVIDNGPFTLAEPSKIFTGDGEFNSESIFEIPYSRELHPELGAWDGNAMTTPLNTFAMNWFVPSSWLSYQYITEQGDPTKAVNKETNEAGVARTHSLRASTIVSIITDYYTPFYIKGNAAEKSTSLAIFGGPNAGKSFARWKIYMNHDTMEKEDASLSGKNITVNRLSDVYLMYAECVLEADNNIPLALEYINKVRDRWALKLIGGEAYDTKDEIMNHLMFVERPMELSVEGHQIRWQDLRRWGLLEDENNIFEKWSKETFYAYKSQSPTLAIDGTKLVDKVPNFSTISNEWPKSLTGTDLGTASVSVIDYEYDQPYRNYSKRVNLFFPIPSNEIRDNSKL